MIRSLERGAGVMTVALVLAMLVPVATAEVAAEVDSEGAYRRTVARGNASTKNLKIWGVARATVGLYPLNPGGDVNGDLWPAILEIPQDGNRPFVVWSRFNGADFDLAWSRWTDAGGWADVGWMTGIAASPGNDLDPVLAADPGEGRPHVAWWRDVGGRGEVYLSLFLVREWMRPFRVSEDGEDARSPTIEVVEAGTIRITYQTPAGPRVRTVKFDRPATITDDLNPLEYLKMQSSTLSESASGP